MHSSPAGRDEEEMFEFDGETTSAVVPESVLQHSLGSTFSVSTWMRHAPWPDQDKHRKEHVLCLADDHSQLIIYLLLLNILLIDILQLHLISKMSTKCR